MGRFQNKIKDGYSIIPNKLVEDTSISDRARFVFCLMATKPSGWKFFQSPLSKQIGVSKETLQKYLKELIDTGWITKKPQKMEDGRWGANGYILHNTPYRKKHRTGKKPIREKTNTGKTKHLVSSNKRVNSNKEEEKKEYISPDQIKPTLLERNERYLPLAKKLAKSIKSIKKINHTTTQLKSWANDFRQLEESNKISISRMKAVLKWYKNNIGGEYIPVIESGSSFRFKFTKLEDAIKRQENPIKGKTPTMRNSYTSEIDMKNLDKIKVEKL